MPLLERYRLPLILLAMLATAQADELVDKRERLETIKQRMAEVNKGLKADREQADSVAAKLRRSEQRIADLSQGLDALRQQLADTEARVAKLSDRQEARSQALTEARRLLRRQITAAYASGQGGALRLLLGQGSPERLDRLLVYFDYFRQARAKRIRQVVAKLKELAKQRRRLEQERARLEALRSERRTKLSARKAERGRRSELLEQVRERIAGRSERLERLRANRARLTELIARLRERLADVPVAEAAAEPFEASRGTLPWPIQGRLLGEDGQALSDQGLLIAAERGSAVRAVARGRVVFADWLRGVGMLVILDHGDGYLTLYGHNQTLYADVGQWVAAGDRIAAAGATGGRDRPALYFEVRSDGQAVGARSWLTASARADAG